MNKKIITILVLCAIGIAALFMIGIGMKEHQIKTITVTSNNFTTGERIPDQHTWKLGNHSPHLAWNNLPSTTKSIAVICDDPDAPHKTWVHWVMFNIPATTKELNTGIAKEKELSDGALQGTNDFDQIGFDGPWPPEGHGDHHYHFKVYALDRIIELPAGCSKQELEKAIQGHIIAQGELIGVYSR